MTFERTTRCQDEVSVARREELILDCARSLLLSRGYNRVTVEDIAQEARIGKGTIYLHWESKAELVAAVLHREAIAVNLIQATALRTRSDTVLLPELARLNFSVIMRRPLYRALYVRDSRLLGRFVDEDSPKLQTYRGRLGRCYADYFTVLVDERLVPGNVDCRLVMTVMEALCLGLVVQAGQFIDDAPIGEPSHPAEVLGQTLDRAFGPPTVPDRKVLARAASRTAALFDELRGARGPCATSHQQPRPARRARPMARADYAHR